MRRKRLTVLLALAGLLAPAAGFAGEKHCEQEADACVHAMTAKLEKRGWIGIEMAEAGENKAITVVVKGSPAETAGLKAGDVILAFNGIALSEGSEEVWAEMKRAMTPGREITVSIERAGDRSDIVVTLGKLPREVLAQWIGQHMLEGHSAPPEIAEVPGG